MAASEQFQQFEGLAVKTAAAVWARWREALSRRGIGVEDAVQEGRAVLLEILPQLTAPGFVQQQRVAYVKRSVWGRLNNWAKRVARDGDARDRPDPPQSDPGDLLDLNAALCSLDPISKAMVLSRYSGESYKAIGHEHGLSAAQAAARVKGGLAMLKKIMHA